MEIFTGSGIMSGPDSFERGRCRYGKRHFPYRTCENRGK
jgi:hypothetical protein